MAADRLEKARWLLRHLALQPAVSRHIWLRPSALRREGPDAMRGMIRRWQAAQPKALSDLQLTAKPLIYQSDASALPQPPLPQIDLEKLAFLQHERRPYF